MKRDLILGCYVRQPANANQTKRCSQCGTEFDTKIRHRNECSAVCIDSRDNQEGEMWVEYNGGDS